MKKFSKVLIALVLIIGLAVGAYFIFSSKDNSKLVHQNVYNLTYNIKSSEDNIVNEINSTVKEMKSLIIKHKMSIDEVQLNLAMYLDLFGYYSTVGNQILENGNFIVNKNIDKYLSNANSSYNKIVQIYNQSYTYLLDTYYEIKNKDSYVETVKSYIQNFYEIFKNLIPEFNNFYYNTCLAYARGLQNTMQKNNFYKQKVEYYAETINQYYTNTTDRLLFATQVLDVQSLLNSDFAKKYFDNKEIYDDLNENLKNLNINEIAQKVATSKVNEYLDSFETEAERQMVQNYIDYVARG